MYLRLIVVGLATLSLGMADTLTLRSGKVVQGSYLGGDARRVRMAVEDRVETYSVSDVSSLQFEGGQTMSAAPPAAPAPAATPVAPPAPAEPPRTVVMRAEPPAAAAAANGSEVPAGTSVVVRMIDDVDSTQSTVGQSFRASVDEPVMLGDKTLIPKGADANVKLAELKEPGKISGGGQLTLELASITVNGRPVTVSSESVSQAGESRKKESAGVIGGTAALGAIIGALAGGGKGAAIGAVSGAGAGTAVQVLTKGTRVRIPSETRLTFALQQPVKL